MGDGDLEFGGFLTFTFSFAGEDLALFLVFSGFLSLEALKSSFLIFLLFGSGLQFPDFCFNCEMVNFFSGNSGLSAFRFRTFLAFPVPVEDDSELTEELLAEFFRVRLGTFDSVVCSSSSTLLSSEFSLPLPIPESLSSLSPLKVISSRYRLHSSS